MKKIFFVLVLLTIATNAFASVPLLARVKGYYKNLTSVALYTNAELVITDRNLSEKRVQLTPPVFEKVAAHVRRLSGAQIRIVKNETICAIYAPIIPTTLDNVSVVGYDPLSGQFDENERQILSTRGCFMHEEIFPFEQTALEDAVELREALVILGLMHY